MVTAGLAKLTNPRRNGDDDEQQSEQRRGCR
jgi:hypothetical protein